LDVNLSGSGMPLLPDIAVNPTSHDFGGVPAGSSASQTFVVRNAGTAVLNVSAVSLTGPQAGDFQIPAGGGAFALAPGSTHNLEVVFLPTSDEQKNAVLSLQSDDPDENPFEINLVGNQPLPPCDPNVNIALNQAATASSGDLPPGNVTDGDNASRWRSARLNTSNQQQWLQIDFGQTIALGRILLRWKSTRRAVSYALQTSNDGANWQDIYAETAGAGSQDDLTGIAGSGQYVRLLMTQSNSSRYVLYEFQIFCPTGPPPPPEPNIAVNPPAHDFGAVAIGSSANQTFVVGNTGNDVLDVSGISLVGVDAGDFQITAGGGAVALTPGASQNVTVQFQPASEGAKSAVLRISSNDPDQNPFDLNLSGSGVTSQPNIAVNPPAYDFGVVNVGSSANQTFVVSNSGTEMLNVTGTTLLGTHATEFQISNGGGTFTLAPGASTNLEVTILPTSEGAKTATLRLSSDDPDGNPLNVALTGTGVVIQPGTEIVILPAHDTFVNAGSATKNYGRTGELRVRQSSSTVLHTYLKFDVAGLAGAVQSATIRLTVINDGPDGGAIYSVSNNYLNSPDPWLETGLNWSNAPALSGTPLSSIGAAVLGAVVEFDVTAAISGNGTFSFAIANGASDRVLYSSKEGSSPPELIMTIGPTAVAGSQSETMTAEEGLLATKNSANSTLAENSPGNLIPTKFELDQNYPNPFNPSTTITFAVPETDEVTLAIYNLRGQLVRTLVSGVVAAGRHSVVWDGQSLQGIPVASGTYIYKLFTKNFVATKKLILTK
ncbi:MAG: choice-of-anchor D domain-containing protein, partial [bacterium]